MARSSAGATPATGLISETSLSETPSAPLAAGAVLNGRYVVERVLGEGGMGVVYAVNDRLNPGRELALKMVRAGAVQLPLVTLFRAEFRTMARLRHPNIAAVYDCEPVQSGAGWLFTLQRIDGIDILSASRGADLHRVIELLVQMCRALSYLHRRGVVHYDIKPGNVLVDRAGNVVLLDFGIAGSAGLTHARGTPGYVAPERAQTGQPIDHRADLYSLGVMASELLASRAPAPWLQAIVRRLCAESPRERYRDANAVIEALNRDGGFGFELETHETREAYVFSSEFVGREPELAALGAHLDACARCEAGAPLALVIGGPAGSGKSRLMRELEIRGHGALRMFARGDCYEDRLLEYGPFAEALRSVVRMLDAAGHSALVDRLGPEIVKLEPQLKSRATASEPLLPAGAERQRMLDALGELFIEAARRIPYVLCLNDLQWAPPRAVEALAHLLRKLRYAIERGERPPLAIVATWRDDEAAEQPVGRFLGTAGDQIHRLHLKPLPTPAVQRLVASMLSIDHVPPTFVERLAAESAGNPLFVEEVMRSLVQNGHVFLDSGRWRTSTDVAALPIPAGVTNALRRRLALLGDAERSVLELLAAHQRPMPLGLLEQMQPDVHAVMGPLRERNFVGWADGARLRVTHDRLRELVYEDIAPERRRASHERIGLLLEAGATDDDETVYSLAHHFWLANDPVRARRYALDGGHRAAAVHANGLAITLLQYAASLEPEPGLHEKLGALLEASGRYDEARARYSIAHEAASEPGSRARVLRRTATSFVAQQRYTEAAQALEAARGLLTAGGADEERVQVLLEGARLDYWRGDWGAMERGLEHVSPLLEAHGTGAQRSVFFVSRALMACRRDRYAIAEQTLADGRTAVEWAERSGNVAEQAFSLTTLGLSYLCAGDLQRAQEALERAVATGTRIGDLTVLCPATTYLAVAHRRRGDRDALRAELSRALAVSTSTQKREYVAAVRGNEAWLAWRDERRDEARAKAEEALSLWQQALPSYPFRWLALFPLLAVALEEGREAEAAERARALLDAIQQRLPAGLEAALAAGTLPHAVEVARTAGFL